MIAVIFCGGYGTRMNNGVPGLLKPLIQVGGKEILAHIISIYQSQGVSEFILLGGYKIEDLKIFAQKNSSSKLNINVVDTFFSQDLVCLIRFYSLGSTGEKDFPKKAIGRNSLSTFS